MFLSRGDNGKRCALKFSTGCVGVLSLFLRFVKAYIVFVGRRRILIPGENRFRGDNYGSASNHSSPASFAIY